MSSTILLPRIMEVGYESYKSLPSILEKLNVKKPLIITDNMMVQLGYVAKVQAVLQENGIASDVFSDTVPEPTDKSIEMGIKKVQQQAYDCVIALGGGSPIDSAKAIAILGKFGGEIRDYKFPRQVNEAGLPIIAIPTTAGTGAEATKFTIITDEQKNEKLLCVGTGFMPIAAVIDYSFTMSVPPRTTADTGIDAMTHAIEAYVSQKRNVYSDGPVLQVMRVQTMDEAMTLINEHEYGNGTCIYTRDGEAARYFTDNIQVGMVGVNIPLPVPVAYQSFGGWKRSLFGDLFMYGPDGVRFFTRRKTITQRWPSASVREAQQFSMPTLN